VDQSDTTWMSRKINWIRGSASCIAWTEGGGMGTCSLDPLVDVNRDYMNGTIAERCHR
jgi:hypothetical protein